MNQESSTEATTRIDLSEETPTAIAVFDIDGVVRDVGSSYRRAIADTVEHFTRGAYRPPLADIDQLKSEGIWNNDWQSSQELVYRYFESKGQPRTEINLNYDALIHFFQSRYRGSDRNNMTGYICQETLLVKSDYFANLTQANILWGFFSGAMRAEAAYVLEGALGLKDPVLIAMEDAPGKPDPTGLFAAIHQLEHLYSCNENIPVLYAGDTVGDMYTVEKAKHLEPSRTWIGVGILPPHIQEIPQRRDPYTSTLAQAGASVVLRNLEQLTPMLIQQLVASHD